MERKIGRASLHDITTEVPHLFRRLGYAIHENRLTASTVYIETAWQGRGPFDDEAEKGVEYARTRLIARARKSGPTLYTLSLTAENQVMGQAAPGLESADRGSSGWRTIPATDMYREYVSAIAEEIKMRVDAGLRVFDATARPTDRTKPLSGTSDA